MLKKVSEFDASSAFGAAACKELAVKVGDFDERQPGVRITAAAPSSGELSDIGSLVSILRLNDLIPNQTMRSVHIEIRKGNRFSQPKHAQRRARNRSISRHNLHV